MASGSQKHGFDESRFEKAVSRNFICSVCLCVLKDPKMCPNNEHAFCSDCITEHLKHSSTCPECADPLTVEMLKRPQRLFLNCLSELNINCDHFSRGCRQYVQLEELPRHAMNCEFAPVLCSNQDCGMEINKRDKIYHETHVCEYRHKCHDCTEIRREMDEMKINMDEMKINMDEMKINMDEMKINMDEMKINMAEVKRDVVEHKGNMAELKTDVAELKTEMAENRVKVNNELHKIKTDLDEIKVNVAEMSAKVKEDLTKVTTELLKDFRATTGEMLKNMNATQSSPHVTPAAELQDIIIAGGWGRNDHKLSSVERFSWQTRSWAPLPPMKQPRDKATSFVYKNQIFVAGGLTNYRYLATDSVEMMNIHGEAVQWQTFSAKLPIQVHCHKTVVYQNRLIVVGGWDETHSKHSDAIYEVLLTPPYSTKLLRRMSEARSSHGTELVNDKLFILGGYTSNGKTDSVVMYDIARNECKQMPSLPYAVTDMSTVSWRDKVILLGGWDKNGRYLNDVVMYNTVTGQTEVLPPMKHKRKGSSAVVTGDRIIIMGGHNGKDDLNSVECYSFSSNLWQELPPIIDRRQWATAVVKPVNIY